MAQVERALAEELAAAEEVEAALAAYSERRYPRVRFAQEASRAVLDAERRINEDNLEQALAAMAAELPAQAASVDEVFSQAA